ncbi:hypothetical protein BRADI_1g23192v3, partial [Brachypodium distachyon]
IKPQQQQSHPLPILSPQRNQQPSESEAEKMSYYNQQPPVGVTRGRTATRRRGTHRQATHRRRRATRRPATPSRATRRSTRSRRRSSSTRAPGLPSWRDAWPPSAAAVSWTPAFEESRKDGDIGPVQPRGSGTEPVA